MDANCTVVGIGGIVFAISFDEFPDPVPLDKVYEDFRCAAEPEITIQAHCDGIPALRLRDEDILFDSDSLWRLYRHDEHRVFVLRSPNLQWLPNRLAVFDARFRRGELYSGLPVPVRSRDGRVPDLLGYPLGELLMMCLLGQGRGLLVHACGIDDGGRGYLFAGNSTHGKSTMAQLWKEQALVLNDDRIVLRRREGRIWMYGTPWHGDYTAVSPQGVPVEKIFFLCHAEANEVRQFHGVAAASRLLARSFPPIWDAEGMRFTLDFCAQVVSIVPCGELAFRPDRQILDFVRNAS